MTPYFYGFPLKTYNPSLIMRKTSNKFQQWNILQNVLLVVLKIVKIIKNKEILRNCQSQEEPKEHDKDM